MTCGRCYGADLSPDTAEYRGRTPLHPTCAREWDGAAELGRRLEAGDGAGVLVMQTIQADSQAIR